MQEPQHSGAGLQLDRLTPCSAPWCFRTPPAGILQVNGRKAGTCHITQGTPRVGVRVRLAGHLPLLPFAYQITVSKCHFFPWEETKACTAARLFHIPGPFQSKSLADRRACSARTGSPVSRNRTILSGLHQKHILCSLLWCVCDRV